MKKLEKRKNILKEAGVLLVAAILVLTAIFIFPMTIAEEPPPPECDVGVTEIISPTSLCTQNRDADFPLEVNVTIENFGEVDVDCLMVKVEIAEFYDGVTQSEEWSDDWCIPIIKAGEVLTSGCDIPLQLEEWYPDILAYGIPFCKQYNVTACLSLPDDNPDNDCLTKIINVSCDITSGYVIGSITNLQTYFQTNFAPPRLSNRNYTPINNSLKQAKKAIEQGMDGTPCDRNSQAHFATAIRKLNDFITDVEALFTNGLITLAEKDKLKADAQSIIHLLTYCSCIC